VGQGDSYAVPLPHTPSPLRNRILLTDVNNFRHHSDTSVATLRLYSHRVGTLHSHRRNPQLRQTVLGTLAFQRFFLLKQPLVRHNVLGWRSGSGLWWRPTRRGIASRRLIETMVGGASQAGSPSVFDPTSDRKISSCLKNSKSLPATSARARRTARTPRAVCSRGPSAGEPGCSNCR
jgi:hypothetical protein